MKFFWKNTQTSIGSLISVIIIIITLTKAEGQGVVYAYDPFAVPNNKFGIHIISASPGESSPAASLVNSTGGDWGYITFLIESKDRNHDKWQEFFNDLRRRHLIPIVRLATQPEGNLWKRPYEGEEQAWADFLDSLNWPTKNRYIVIYNEPNHATEWGGSTDPKLYARVLDKTITALKLKNRDFFVLNGGFDASAPNEPPDFEDEVTFLTQMEQAKPGILNKLDGWVSHSYPNPAFAGSPFAIGKGTIRTWLWEIQVLRSLGVGKNLPVFITETGWKHMEGLTSNPFLPTAETVSEYFRIAFENVFSSNQVVAVTPFLLTYQETPFDHFSFKKVGELGFYPQYQTILNMPKTSGIPIQENKAKLTHGEVYSSIVAGEKYSISLTFKNTGQSIWNEDFFLVPMEGGPQLGMERAGIPKGINVEPGQDHTFILNFRAPRASGDAMQKGTFNIKLNLFNGSREFDTNSLQFTTEVKLPVILQVLSKLKWKNTSAGEYVLRVSGVVGDSSQKVILDSSGKSGEIEARYLLPDYSFEFSLEKPFYRPKTITQKVSAGVNILDFGVLNPDIFSILLHPVTYFKQN